MKRSPLGVGKRSLDRGSTFEKRATALKRVAPLRPVRPKAPANPHLAALNRRLAFLFHDSVQAPFCPICHERAEYLHAHHCVERQFLERELEAIVTPERLLGIVWDPRNALGACGRCHNSLHGPSLRSRITREHLRPAVYEFAAELDRLVGNQRFTVRLEAYRTQGKEVA